ncbi:MAG: transglycosylase domain-containing protein [Mogibacterium sp.]|nr:transglycosylase domain-containing protein [Mogibacterium sp.]
MRSDNKKNTDPKREIDDFLSKFDEPENATEYEDCSEETKDSSSNKQNFSWKELKPHKSKGKKNHKKDKSERKITKEPAPSAIKVQRKRDDDETLSLSSDLTTEESKASEDNLFDVFLHEFDSDFDSEFDSDYEADFEAVLTQGSSADSAAESDFILGADSEADSDFILDADSDSETNSNSDSDFGFLADFDSDFDSETDNEIEETKTAVASAASSQRAAASVALDLFNAPKENKTPINTDYVRDARTGKYRKTDLGKRKRVEFIDKKKASAFSSIFRRKPKTKKVKKPLKYILFLKDNPNYDSSKGASYEQGGKTIKNKPYKFSFLKLIRDFAFLGLFMLLICVGIISYVIYKAPVFDYSDLYATVATSSVVYDDEGKQIDNIYYTENRRIVEYKDMPEHLIESFIAIEDKTFWKHHGFNWVRMVGAVLSSITGSGQISGTSTITQQLARNIYLPEIKSDRTITRKLQEMYYAARIEHAHSKEEIVEAYLNTIYLGYGCYGVNSAAKTYFSKNVKDLSLVESASLAALPQSPHIYALLKNTSEGGEVSEDSKIISKSPDKIVTNDNSKYRRDLTLDLMLEQGLISQAEYDSSHGKALNDFINPTLKSGINNYSYFHEYLIDTIISDLMDQYELSYEDAERKVYTGGLQIYSTVDSVAQKTVAQEFRKDDNFPFVSAIYNKDGDGNILNNDGQIALYDYEDYFDKDDNFRLSGKDGDIKFNDDGSATIYQGHNLLLYETEVGDAIDYSIEFKNYYIFEDETLYSTQGGYVNIPSNYKSGDDDGNVIISADFFNEDKYKDAFRRDGNDLVIAETGYSLGRRTLQPQAAMVIVGVGTGEVKAMVGGRQFTGEKLLNRAVGSRQPGSSIKPLAVYGAALQKSYELEKAGKKWKYTNYKIDKQGTKGWGDYVTVHSSIEDEKTKINGKYWPKNATNNFSGTNNFRTAIQQSINTCAVKLLMQLGADYALKQVRKFGITTAVDAEQDSKINDVNSAAMALGAMTNGVTPLEMALAYAAFPGGGMVNTPICYTKVLDRDGKVILEGKSEQSEALNEGVAWIMTDVLQKVVSRGICGGAAIDGIKVGGKTGTTNDEYDIWFDGFTPSYAAALWIGTDNNIDMGTTSYIATTTWSKIMSQIPKALEGKYKKQPDNVIERWGDYYTEGTEVGLSSWSYEVEKKKAREEAYKKWLKEREEHKKWVVDEPSRPIYDKVYISEEEIPYHTDKILHRDENGVYYEVDTGKRTKKKGHWEYKKGWREGDFKYTFDGETYTD